MTASLDRHLPRLLPDGRMIGTEATVAAITYRHRRQVAQYCEPIGCDPVTRLLIYDVDAAAAILDQLPRRERTPRKRARRLTTVS